MRAVPILAFLLALTAPAVAAPPGLPAPDDRDCPPVCAGACVKPIVLPDRWDDATALAGHEDWAGNGRHDQERFDDANANRLFDLGEPFTDSNANGQYDAEAYHPFLTGYVPDPVPGNVLAPEGDLGRLITLRPSRESRVVSSHYFAAAFPPVNKGTPVRGARAFREALESCVSPFVEKGDWIELEPGSMEGVVHDALRALYEQDPRAEWDPVSRTVVGSRFDGAHQKRVVLLALLDPRIGPESGRAVVQATKIAAFFFEAPGADGTVTGRFLKVRAAGLPCGCSCTAEEAFLRHCP
jgi:hypothetical protein